MNLREFGLIFVKEKEESNFPRKCKPEELMTCPLQHVMCFLLESLKEPCLRHDLGFNSRQIEWFFQEPSFGRTVQLKRASTVAYNNHNMGAFGSRWLT